MVGWSIQNDLDLQRNSLQIAPDGLFQPLNFKIFPGENAPGPPYSLYQLCYSTGPTLH